MTNSIEDTAIEYADITFYNRVEEAGSIGKESLAVTVDYCGDWTMFKMVDGIPGGIGRPIGVSWVTLAFPEGSYPLTEATRRTIALNALRGRRDAVIMKDKRKEDDAPRSRVNA